MDSLGLKRGTVALSAHDLAWQARFEEEKELLLKVFGDKILAIEHIGSTAIPGVPAKPILDMLAAVTSLDDIEVFIQELPRLGYEYIPERRFADRQFFPKGPESSRTHHLSLVEIDSETGWHNHLLFRNYLRSHEQEKRQYAELKEKLAREFADNREEYTERKSTFILDVIAKARAQE